MIATMFLVVVVVVVVVSRLLLPGFSSRKLLNRDQIVQALTRLGELANAEGHTLTLVVVGGSALILRYNARESTQDVDVFMGTPPERRATRRWAGIVAKELGIPADWLNDGAKAFMNVVSYGQVILEAPGIIVHQASSEQLLAMKLSAWRDQQDANDAAVVLRDLIQTYGSKELLWNAITPYVNDMKAQYAFEELWEELHG